MKLWLLLLRQLNKIWKGPGRFAIILLCFMSIVAVYEGLGGKPNARMANRKISKSQIEKVQQQFEKEMYTLREDLVASSNAEALDSLLELALEQTYREDPIRNKAILNPL